VVVLTHSTFCQAGLWLSGNDGNTREVPSHLGYCRPKAGNDTQPNLTPHFTFNEHRCSFAYHCFSPSVSSTKSTLWTDVCRYVWLSGTST